MEHQASVIGYEGAVFVFKADELPGLLFGSKCWSLTKEQSQRLERVHSSSCFKGILGIKLSNPPCLHPSWEIG